MLEAEKVREDEDDEEEEDIALRNEIKFRKIMSSFLNNDKQEYDRELAGETLIFLTSSEESADMLFEFNILDVCTAILSHESLKGRLHIACLCILGNLVSLKYIGDKVLVEASPLDALQHILTSSVEPRVLSECMRVYIVIFSRDNFSFEKVADPEKQMTAIGNALYLIHTASLDIELLSRSWELCYYISQMESDLYIPHLCLAWSPSSAIPDALSVGNLSLYHEGFVEGKSGFSWLLMFLDVVYSKYTFAAERMLFDFDTLAHEAVCGSIFYAIESSMVVTREESFSATSTLDSILLYFSETDTELLIRCASSLKFQRSTIFLLTVMFDTFLAKDEQLTVAVIRICFNSWIHFKERITNIDIVPDFCSAARNLCEYLAESSSQKWLSSILERSIDLSERARYQRFVEELEYFLVNSRHDFVVRVDDLRKFLINLRQLL